jgi:hypothetical protein
MRDRPWPAGGNQQHGGPPRRPLRSFLWRWRVVDRTRAISRSRILVVGLHRLRPWTRRGSSPRSVGATADPWQWASLPIDRVSTQNRSSRSVRLQTARFRPIGMEQLWNRGGATAGKRSALRPGENGLIWGEPLPPAATRCRLDRMVRRGSTVRVRQRALQKRRNRRFLVQTDLLRVERAVSMEPFMEHSRRRSRS